MLTFMAALMQQTDDPTLSLGERFAKARKDAGLDQQQLADLVGVSRPLISKWERNKSVPDVTHAAAVAEITEKSFGWLCGVSAKSRCFSPLALVPPYEEPELFPETNPHIDPAEVSPSRTTLTLFTH